MRTADELWTEYSMLYHTVINSKNAWGLFIENIRQEQREECVRAVEALHDYITGDIFDAILTAGKK